MKNIASLRSSGVISQGRVGDEDGGDVGETDVGNAVGMPVGAEDVRGAVGTWVGSSVVGVDVGKGVVSDAVGGAVSLASADGAGTRLIPAARESKSRANISPNASRCSLL